jgi:Putative restriction endonuclease
MSISTPRSKTLPPTEPTDRSRAVPPLLDGDRLSRDEFMRRYEAMPNLAKAELIEGVVHVPSPVRHENHGDRHCSLVGLIFLYRARTPGVSSGNNSTVQLDLSNSRQPDGVMFIHPAYGGQVKFDEKGSISGAPELVAEVAASSASFDLHQKLEAYERNGVREYILWRVLEHEFDWFILRNQQFQKLEPAEDGILRSTIFPGLWLDPSALQSEDFDKVLAVHQRGLDSPDHAEFVARLRQAGAANKA